MKQHYVKTGNHHRFMAAVSAVENRGSPEACILLLTGAPGTGKSCTIDHWGAERDAIILEGIPGMGVTFVRDYLAEPYQPHTELPTDAVDSGFRRDGDRLWLAPDRSRAYVGASPDDVELWPRMAKRLTCA